MSSFYTPVWKEAPFLRILIPLILGIVLANNLQPSIYWVWIMLGVFLLAFCFFNAMRISFQWAHGWIRGLLLETVIGLLGMLVEDLQIYQSRTGNLGNFYKKGDWVRVIVSNPPVKKNNLFQYESSKIGLISKNGIINPAGSITITIKIDSGDHETITPNQRDQILFHKNLQEINYADNISSAPHRGYNVSQTNKFRVFLRQNEFVILSTDKIINSSPLLELTKDKILAILKKNIAGDRESGLAEALLLGYRQDLDKELLQSYANTGVVHIIAISGLHLALIFAILKFLMKPICKRKSGKWIAAILIISMLWAFSFLSGSSPSVLRSALMFTMMVLAENLRKNSSVYNGLFASAFILLMVNPSWLWDLGFQLSYLAVLSIIIFYKPIYQCINLNWKAVDLAWQSIALTLSAQILTTPICILNFHQFPLYFLPANLLAVPLSSLILIGELLLCAFSFFSGLSHFLGTVLTKLIWMLNSYIDYISSLPFCTWNQLQISIAQTFFMYMVIGGIAIWIIKRQKAGLIIGLASVVCCLAFRSASLLKAFHQERIIIYNIPSHQAVDCILGRQFIFFGDTSLEGTVSRRKFYLDPYRITLRLKDRLIPHPKDGKAAVFFWSKKKMLILNDSLPSYSWAATINFDLILLSKNCPVSIGSLHKLFNNAFWIFDRTNSERKLNQWKTECEQLGLFYYNLAEKGTFVMNMD
jgi:competence protein ComEC